MAALIKPARGGYTTRHGEDIGRDSITGAKGHVGVDIGHGDAQLDDLKVSAPAAGKVTAAGAAGSYGNRIIITHDDGTWSLLAHLAAIYVRVGERVERGQLVGLMGNTGTVYVHLHWEYHLANGTAVDPVPYITALASTTTRPLIVQEDDTMPIPFRLNGKHTFFLSSGSIKHSNWDREAEYAKNVFVADDKWIEGNTQELVHLLNALDIPVDVVVGTTGKQRNPITGAMDDVEVGMILNPDSARFEKGGSWSWARASYAERRRNAA
jgi:hypothetical protein